MDVGLAVGLGRGRGLSEPNMLDLVSEAADVVHGHRLVVQSLNGDDGSTRGVPAVSLAPRRLRSLAMMVLLPLPPHVVDGTVITPPVIIPNVSIVPAPTVRVLVAEGVGGGPRSGLGATRLYARGGARRVESELRVELRHPARRRGQARTSHRPTGAARRGPATGSVAGRRPGASRRAASLQGRDPLDGLGLGAREEEVHCSARHYDAHRVGPPAGNRPIANLDSACNVDLTTRLRRCVEPGSLKAEEVPILEHKPSTTPRPEVVPLRLEPPGLVRPMPEPHAAGGCACPVPASREVGTGRLRK